MQPFKCMVARQIDGYQIEKRFIRKDGTMVHTLMAGVDGPADPDQAGHFHMHLIDRSDRKRVEAKLKEVSFRKQLGGKEIEKKTGGGTGTQIIRLED